MTVKPPSDLYKILNVSRTATTREIKQAYRKLAMALHPDKTDGDPHKANVFKVASEAYSILSDHSKRTAYDTTITHKQSRRPAPPPNYRKVYSPKAPPGFKTFDSKRHHDMHYGDGIMREELERARRRAERASARNNSGYDYESPLGKGFSFHSENDHNPYSKRARQGPPPQEMFSFEYEEAHFYDFGNSHGHTARRIVGIQEEIRERMNERRKNRIPRQERQKQREEEAMGCSIM